MTRSPTLPCLLVALVMGLGCSTVRSSSVATGSPGRAVDASQVALAATWVPEGATQVALVETHAHFQDGFAAVMDGFRAEVGARGGNFGKVDSMRTRFEIQTVRQSQTFQCGSGEAPRTCTRQVNRPVEVAITTVIGRAFRVGGAR